MSEFPKEEQPEANQFSSTVYPPKPVLIEKSQNSITRSLLSLLIYALLFYFLIEQNVAYIAAILLVIIIHEMGHFLFMKVFNYSNVKIFIVPLLGALTSGKKQTASQWQMSVIILAGPLPGIIIGLVLFGLNLNLHDPTLKMLAQSFLIINLFNCLPFYPLDGGRLIETLFFRENHVIRLVFGIFSVVVLAILFLWMQSYVMLIIPTFILLELINETKNQKIRDYLKQEKINYYTDYESLPDKDYWLMRDCLIFSFPKKYISAEAGRYEYSLSEPIIIQHINNIIKVNLKIDLNGFKRVMVLFFYLFVLIGPIVYILMHSKIR